MNWANRVTLFRIALSPVFLALFTAHRNGPSIELLFVLLAVFLVSEFSDVLDGWVARRFQQTSDLGKLLDPFSDVISRLTIFLCLLTAGIAPFYAFAVLFYREFSMLFLRLLMVKEGIVLAASTGGKIKAWIYFFAGLSGLVQYSLPSFLGASAADGILFWSTQILFAAAAVQALVSFAMYFRTYWKARGSR